MNPVPVDRVGLQQPVTSKRPQGQFLLHQFAASNDQELMRRVARGEAAALQRLLRDHWSPVLRYATYLLGSLDAAEDVVQDAFVRLWMISAQWQFRGCVRSFLYCATRNLALNEKRRERVRALWARQAVIEDHGSCTPVHVFEALEIHIALEEAMAALPDRRREVFWLSRCQEMTHREIADVLGISVQTVANQMSAALVTVRNRLRPFLEKNGDDRDPGIAVA